MTRPARWLLCGWLGLGSAAQAALDCDVLRESRHGQDQQVVMVYLDASTTGARQNAIDRWSREVQTAVLTNARTMLGGDVAQLPELIFLVCSRPWPDFQETDIRTMYERRVNLAIFRDPPFKVLGHAVVPALYQKRSQKVIDWSVDLADDSPADVSLQSWTASFKKHNAELVALLGLALGLRYLDEGDGPRARLMLCISRTQWRQSSGVAAGSPQSTEALKAEVDRLIGRAKTMPASTKAPPDAALLKSVGAACGEAP